MFSIIVTVTLIITLSIKFFFRNNNIIKEHPAYILCNIIFVFCLLAIVKELTACFLQGFIDGTTLLNNQQS